MIWQKIQANKGVTLIELMIVLVIAGILVGGIYTLFATQQRSYFVQDRVTGIQQDARAVLTFMGRDIRMAGFVAGAGSLNGFSDDGATPFVIGGCNFALNPTNRTDAPDDLTVVLGIEELGIVQTVAGTLVTLDALDTNTPFATAVTNNLAFVAFDLQVGRLYKVSSVDFGNDEITVVNFSSGEKIVGGKAYWVQAITYQVQNGILQRAVNSGTPQPLAGDGETTFVEDLQFAYQVEGSNDWIYDDDTAAWPGGSNFADIRMVRININVRTAVEDATVADADPAARFDQPPLEDHTAAGLNTDDGFRRRVYTTEVKVRNL